MMPAEKIRVLIVDDSVVVRLMLSDLIRRDAALECVGAAVNGRAALDCLDTLRPDVVIMDVEMPVMGGVEAVAAIRVRNPRLPVIMFSTHTEEGAMVTIEALARGAADYVTKPTNAANSEAAIQSIREQLLPKIKALGRPSHKLPPPTLPSPAPSLPASLAPPPPLPFSVSRSKIDLVCIAASTGGPNALETLLMPFPANFPVPIVIVQHMPPAFTRHLAQRLASRCAIRVREAESGEALEPGVALIAPGGFHLVVKKRGTGGFVSTNQDAEENSCRPSADVLFRSVSAMFGQHTLAVVLTGMGQDGLHGCAAIRAAGGKVLVQDEATSVVWGMPGSVARAGLADMILPIEHLAADVMRAVQGGRT